MRTMLWRSDDAPHSTFLGSIHLLKGEVPPWVIAEHERSEVVVFEADLSNVPPPPVLPGGANLFQLSPDAFVDFSLAARTLGVEQDQLNKWCNLYPLAAAQQLGIALLQHCGVHFDLGVEAVLKDRTEEPRWLEEVEAVYRHMYLEPPIAEQLASLRHSIRDLPNLPRRFAIAARAWRAGSPEDVLSALGFDEKFNLFPGIAEGLFARRHREWLPRATEEIEAAEEAGYQLLIVVGCSHLTGPQNFLVDLEEYSGYRFEQV